MELTMIINYEELPVEFNSLNKIEEYTARDGDEDHDVYVMKGKLDGREYHVWKESIYNLMQLPLEVIAEIFSFAATQGGGDPKPLDTLSRLEETCKAFRKLSPEAKARCINEQKLSFESLGVKTKEQALKLAGHLGSHLHYLDLREEKRFINVVCDKFTDSDLKQLAGKCPNLEEIHLYRGIVSRFTEEGLNYLRSLAYLKSLEVSDGRLNQLTLNQLTDACIENLPKSLTALNLSYCTRVTDACIENLPQS